MVQTRALTDSMGGALRSLIRSLHHNTPRSSHACALSSISCGRSPSRPGMPNMYATPPGAFGLFESLHVESHRLNAIDRRILRLLDLFE